MTWYAVRGDILGTCVIADNDIQANSAAEAEKMLQTRFWENPAHLEKLDPPYGAKMAQHIREMQKEANKWGIVFKARKSKAKRNPSPPAMSPSAKLSPAGKRPRLKTVTRKSILAKLGLTKNPKRVTRVKKKPPVKRAIRAKRLRKNPIVVLHPYVIKALQRKGGAVNFMYWDGEKFHSDKKRALHFDSATDAHDFAQTIVKRLPYSIQSLTIKKAREA